MGCPCTAASVYTYSRERARAHTHTQRLGEGVSNFIHDEEHIIQAMHYALIPDPGGRGR